MDASPTLAHGKDKFYDAELGIYKKTGNKSSKSAMEMEERISKSKVYSRVILYFLLLTPSLQKIIIKASDTADLHTFFEDDSTRAMYILIWTAKSACLPLLTLRNEKHRISYFASPFHRRLHQHILQCGGKIIDSPASPTLFFFPETLLPSAMLSDGPNGIQMEQRIGFDKCRNRGTKRGREQVPVVCFNSTDICSIPPLDFMPLGPRCISTASPIVALPWLSHPSKSHKEQQAIFPTHCGRAFTYSSDNVGMAKPLHRSTMAVPRKK